MKALHGERRIDVGDKGLVGLDAQRDPFVSRLIEVLAQTHATRELAVEEGGVARLAHRLDRRLL